MPLNDKNVPFVTAAGCCLAAASGFTFGQRHYFAGTIGSQDVVAHGLWVFLARGRDATRVVARQQQTRWHQGQEG